MATESKVINEQTSLECEVCKNVVKIWRKRSRLKKPQHLKHMYCHQCKETTGHLELKGVDEIPSWIEQWQNEQYEKRGYQ
ncbi:ribosome associated inhibitor A; zinc finger domain [Bacillus phage Bastille]|uniref:Uncharacterized protein n=6 Tax=Bastillevirus TaxID=1918010 RepID=A0A024B093_9CAUD|nr:ribosome associated inhibitor A; zinc finger domain [Bacillus phage Bastille]YP_009035247.1 ribosome associated inhibitor A; zinc finger domain [Bacillus phage Hoody T]YP_009035574.1 ribosome associated inhibitor A; zinc finger domain [Bacillus phage Evoli]YP_009036954.1 ribosome associated inhibitor A; zinc finger domain [Bacillus phage CAM003]AMW61806.1 hypothetical protein DNAM5_55 [Bacillus phage Vinny]ASR79491.1 hypothetical protein OTK52_53 [Bacillus phage OTooleKemple52]ASR79732.1 h